MELDKAKGLRDLLAGEEIIIVPGAYNALVAKLIEEAGFKAVYASGAGITNTYLGDADVGLITMTEMLAVVRNIVLATHLPVIADIDTGYGNAINLRRTVREFEIIGVAGVQIEDQVTPKKCGHFAGKQVVSKEEMIKKIEAAVDVRTRDDLVIIARTDARAIYGLEEAIERARAYAEAGADVTFVEAPRSVEELRQIACSLEGIPQMANMVEGGCTPLVPAEELSAMGFKLVIYANMAMLAGLKAMQRALALLARDGTSAGFQEELLITWEERQRLVGLKEVRDLEKKYAPSERRK